MMVLFIPVTLAIVWGMAIRPSGLSGLNLFSGLTHLAVICAISILIFAAIAIWRWRIETRIRRLIPQYDGLVCPFCREPLRAGEKGPTCPSCGGHFASEGVQRFWEAYGLDRLAAAAQLRRIAADAGMYRGLGVRRAGRWLIARLRSHPGFALAFPLLICLGVGLVSAAYSGGSILGGCLGFAPNLFILGGFMVIALAFHRVGDEVFCATCGYQLAPAGINPDRCPECGAGWIQPGGTIRGRRARRPWMVAVGVLLLLMSFALTLLPLRWRGVATNVLPTGSLIRDVTALHSGSTDGQWAALSKRTLRREQIIELAEGLLAYRRSSICLTQEAEKWFTVMIAANRLPAELVERYYREMLDISLVAPDRVPAGENFDVRLQTNRHTNIFTSATLADSMVVYFGGFFRDDSTDAVAHGGTFIYGGLMAHDEYAPAAQFKIDQPGPCRIRAVFWLIAGPNAAITVQAVWQPDGTPVIPSGTSWWKRVELEKPVEITP